MAETFKLPVSSYEELIKIIQAYSAEKEGTVLSLDSLQHSTGMDRTLVSANNGFLVQIGLITEGNKKAATELGRALGRAYSSKIEEEIIRMWKEIISETDFLNRMVSAVRIRKGMDRSNLLNHIVYSSGLKENSKSRAGAGAIIEICKVSGVLNEVDGKLTVNDESSTGLPSKSTTGVAEYKSSDLQSTRQVIAYSGTAGVTININITCSVEEIDIIGEKIINLIETLSKQP